MKKALRSAMIFSPRNQLVARLALLLALALPLWAQQRPEFRLILIPSAEPTEFEPRSILITALDPLTEPLTGVELDLRLNKKPVDIVRIYQPEERPVALALLIADNTGPEVAQSLPALADFLRSLPAGSAVLTAYARRGTLEVVQPFTRDLAAAAAALRAPQNLPEASPTDLGQLVSDLLEHFPATTTARAQILYVGEGSANDPYRDVTLNRAIAQAQERGLAVWTIHAGAVPIPLPPASHAQAETALQRLSQETGGRSFALGLQPPALDPYLEELRGLLDRQYLVEFAPPTEKRTGKRLPGALTLRVRGRELRLLYPRR